MISRRIEQETASGFGRALGLAWITVLLSVGLLSLCPGCGQKEAPASPPPKSYTRNLQNVVRRETPAVRNDAAAMATAAPMVVPENSTAQNAAIPERGSKVAFYELKMDPTDLRGLERSAHSNNTFPAVFSANGVVYDHVKVRFRGQWSRSWPKKSLKIFFNPDHLFEGHHVLNLNSAWRDPAMVREPLAYYIYAACGVPASRSHMARLNLNGQFRGLYVEVEPVDKAFLSRWNLKGAEVFKAVSHEDIADERFLGDEMAYVSHYEREVHKGKENKTEGQLTPEQQAEGLRSLQAFCKDLSTVKDKLDFFQKNVDVDKYINYLAATVLIQNWDSYNKNHYIVYDAQESHKWLIVPWDLDRTFGDHWNQSFGESQFPLFQGTRPLPGITGWNRLEDKFLSVPALRKRFLDRLSELLAKEFTTENLYPILESYESDIAADAALDFRRWPRYPANLQEGIAGVKTYIEERRTFLLAEIKRSR